MARHQGILDLWTVDQKVTYNRIEELANLLGICPIGSIAAFHTRVPLLYETFLTVGTDCNNDPFSSHFAIVRSYVELSLAKMSDTKTRLVLQ